MYEILLGHNKTTSWTCIKLGGKGKQQVVLNEGHHKESYIKEILTDPAYIKSTHDSLFHLKKYIFLCLGTQYPKSRV